MLPWVYEFRWEPTHIIFLGVFFSVLTLILITLARAGARTVRDIRSHLDDNISWTLAFEELASSARVCRHELNGDIQHRTCTNEFDCRSCEAHRAFLVSGRSASAAVIQRSPTSSGMFGLHVPLDRYYHRGHTWVKPEADGTITVGLDDLGRRMVGKIEAVELPGPGERVTANGHGWTIISTKGRARLRSPIDGNVIAAGSESEEWFLRVAPVEGGPDMSHLLRGPEVKPWVMRELERLQFALSPDGGSPALADGGVPVRSMPDAIPMKDWEGVWEEMFLQA
ncbi:MAG: hypothetical protein A2X68_09845 [Ignavibacteria bacterium GWC2_56_12]|nr:MAG: hypothetical protein A2X68_09845 [Ignavibacteria bacterium GWC2_56_12]